MTPIGQMFGYLSGALIIVSMLMGVVIYRYKAELAESLSDVNECNMNKKTIQSAFDDQNEQIERQRIDYEQRLKSIKPVTKLKVIYRDRNITKEQCNETASVIDSIRNVGF
jgi:multidrug resistance efflux pump